MHVIDSNMPVTFVTSHSVYGNFLAPTVDAKIMFQFCHRSTIVQLCNRSYKTAIKQHSMKCTTGVVWPYHYNQIVCNSFCPYYPHG